MFKKRKSVANGDARKVGVGLKRKREENKRRLSWRLAWWGSTEKEASHVLGLRGKHQHSDQRSNRIRFPCIASTAAETKGKEHQIARSSEEGREAGRSFMKRENSTGLITVPLRNTSTDSKGTTFVILEHHASTSVRKERLSPTSKARREASRNQFVEKGRRPDRIESFCARARPGLLNPSEMD